MRENKGNKRREETPKGKKPFKKEAPKKKVSPKVSKESKGNTGAAKRSTDGKIRLNRFLAQAGICSRREADEIILTGAVEVNGKVVDELGFKVDPINDNVKYGGQRVVVEKPRYVVLNKPKDFITTSKDPQNRKTVMHLVSNACVERIYPIGRLDRNTLGVLVFTNDGELANKLMHPRHKVSKTYLVETNKNVDFKILEEIVEGFVLDDGFVNADEMSYVNKEDKRTIMIRIHSGRNRIVRRIFEHYGFEVRKLDRIDFAGITKKGLKRGEWRHLTEKEVGFLKMV